MKGSDRGYFGRTLAGRSGGADKARARISPPWDTVRNWPLVGPQLYDFWTLASSNVRSALTYLLPQLKPLGEILLER